MQLSDFTIGRKFYLAGKAYQCTDVGSRVAIGVPLNAEVGSASPAELKAGTPGKDIRTLSEEQTREAGWLAGPPYALAEMVFDEDDMQHCSLSPAVEQAA